MHYANQKQCREENSERIVEVIVLKRPRFVKCLRQAIKLCYSNALFRNSCTGKNSPSVIVLTSR